MSDHRTLPDVECPAEAFDGHEGVLLQLIDAVARLREENDELRRRILRLESRSDRDIDHPSESSDGTPSRFA